MDRLTCSCKEVLLFSKTKGWPKRCPGCNAKINAPLPGPQTLALQSEADVIVMGGGVFGGKSYAAVLFAMMYYSVKNATILVLRKERAQLTGGGSLWDKFKTRFFGLDGAKFRESAAFFDIRFPKFNSVINFGGFRHESTFEKYEGNEYSIIIWDEAQQLSFNKFNMISQRNRSPEGCGILKPRIFLTCNPPTPDDDGYWLFGFLDWWLDEEGYPIPDRAGVLQYYTIEDNEIIWVDENWVDENGVGPTSVTFIPALAKDNPVGLAANPTYMQKIRAQTTAERARKELGNWKVRPGAKMFGKGKFHYIDHKDLPQSLKKIRFWDLGIGKDERGPRNGVGGVRGFLLPCPKCDGKRFVKKGKKPCKFCNTMTSATGEKIPIIPKSDVDKKRKDAFWIDHVVWEQLESAGELERLHIHYAEFDGPDVPQYFEEEKGTSGKVATRSYEKILEDWDVQGVMPTGKKQMRAGPVAGLAEYAYVFVVRGPWDSKFESAVSTFTPSGAGDYKDIIDAKSGCYAALLTHKWPAQFHWRM